MKMNKPISVAIISSSVGKTPQVVANSFVFDEAYRLAQRGVETHVVRSNIEGESISYGIHFHGIERMYDIQVLNFFARNITCYPPISLVRKPTALYLESLYALNVSKVVERNGIGLIHAHFAYPEGFVGLLTKRDTQKPLIVTVHGCDILTESSVNYGLRLNKKLDYIIRKVLNHSDAIICASHATFNEVRKISSTGKIYYIPNGVDVQRFRPSIDSTDIKNKLGITENFVIFTLRNHEPRYGLEYLIKAIPLVLRERKDVVFVIGGEGSLKHYHEQLAIKLGIKDKVIFTGRIKRNEVQHYYAMSDIVVVPSVQEAFGLVVSEALASGKPVIGTKVGGIPDQIIDGYNGFLVKPKDPKEIADKILWLLQHPDAAKHMGTNGRKIVEEKFDINKRVQRIISLYEEVLSTKHFSSV